MIDVITTTLSKHVKSHPDLAKHFAISGLPRHVKISSKNTLH
jgi:hypothetical protein